MAKDKDNTAIYTAYEDWEGHDPSKPERNLLVAILVGAINDLNKVGEPGRKAHRYFISEDESYLFSFRSVCNLLSIDSKKILTLTGIKGNKAPKVEELNKILSDLNQH